jgi:hypothetical protein
MRVTIITENEDVSANKLIEALEKRDIDFSRINVTDNNELNFNSDFDSINKTDAVVFRRGSLRYFEKSDFSDDLNLQQYLKAEHFKLQQYFEYAIPTSIIKIGSYLGEVNNNKLINLKIASESGLLVPDYLVTNSRASALRFLSKHGRIITKDIHNSVSFIYPSGYYESAGTLEIFRKDLIEKAEVLFPIFLQKQIDKKFEIRGVFVLNRTFSIATFSLDFEEVIDIRFSDSQLRVVPYQLTDAVEKAVVKMAQKLNLNFFSFDLIVAKNDDVYFLEINPMGQYDIIDVHGNCSVGDYIVSQLLKAYE